MRKTYQAAIQGYGNLFSALRTCCGNRFSSIRCFIMVPERHEKLELHVTRDARTGDDLVKLTRRNWRTGASSSLYDGKLTGGEPIRDRQQRE